MVSAYHVGDVGVCAVDGTASRPPARSTTVKKNLAGLPAEQSDRLQDLARAGVPLSIREIRHLFWRLVLATQQCVERILAWSTWRRWHQGIAKYWHYKRRAIS
jgi:hypothetical protein